MGVPGERHAAVGGARCGTPSRPRGAGATRNDPGVPVQLSPCQKVFAGPHPLWLRFPALAPDKERRPLTPAVQQRLQQLATPRPDSRQGGASPRSSGPSFAPKIGRVWKLTDWPRQICCHSRALQQEVEGWFHQRDVMNKSGGKKSVVALQKMLRQCGHEGEQSVCRHCRKRLCEACWEKVCEDHKDEFMGMAPEEKVEALIKELGIKKWQAKALLRTAVPAPDRLYSQSPDMARLAAQRRVLKLTGLAREEAEKAQAEQDELDAVLKQQQEAAHREWERGRSSIFERLTTGKPPKEFPDIPYLPWMREALPHLADLAVGAEDLTPEELLTQLKEQGRLTEWQAGALLRCSVPVFERLYTPSVKAGSPERHLHSPEQLLPRDPPLPPLSPRDTPRPESPMAGSNA